jgi:ABC-2 type transport system ATP-binding protein
MAAMSPKFFEILPLTLEEIFISEMEVRGYDYSKVLF